MSETRKKCKCGAVVTRGESHQCPVAGKKITPEDDSDFFISFLVGAETHSTLFGTLIGGDPVGAALGDALFDDD